VQINTSKDQVWLTLADLGTIQNYNPMVAKSYYTSQSRAGVGSTRHCDFSPIGSVEERVVSWEDGEQYTIEVYKSHMMPMAVTAHFQLQPEGDNTTVNLMMEYSIKGGKLGGLAGKPMQSQVARMAERMLNGLKHYLETGEQITPEILKKVRKAAIAA
jgi:carbon monoxide dehydrogenase subunit G